MKRMVSAIIFFGLILHVNAQIGRVGINTPTPSAMLHVKDSCVLFTGVYPLAFTPGAPPVSGAGTRMMWYPDKAAFRAGSVDGSEWNKDNIGSGSIAMGHNTKASGSPSYVFGESSTASGNGSVAIGNYVEATSNNAIAFGTLTHATGINATTMGQATTASGMLSTAMGFGSVALGTHSLATGFFTRAVGNFSTSHGYNTKSKSYCGTVIGIYNDSTNAGSINSLDANNRLFQVGNGTSDIARSNAMTVLQNGRVGINTVSPSAILHVKDSSVVFTGAGTLPGTPGNPPVSGAGIRMMWYPDKAALRAGFTPGTGWDKDNIGTYSTAFGYGTKANGQYSTAMGFGSTASSSFTTAMGYNSTANGAGSTAMGENSTASGTNSTAMGYGTTASNSYTTAMGYGTNANGYGATAIGNQTTSSGEASTAIGGFTIASGHYS
ncbi:MAG TPA: hypothetical protein VMZ69_11795, partial [Saprospiraceae bacterium]|nr:hypothetical protein [Saprospiraceae bacterium]